ncbi:unnamed protein product [Trichogramma brassicae]|uniref:Solute carrier family 66 member 2 n=1 Tax=Trichogramma brassicae TaxID=86971 RepID=A0A6H5IIK1_9HYME|nr:unnamed protein product [Trichogramma brassicae]
MVKLWEGLTINDVAGAIASLTMIFGGIVPFIPQYQEIIRKQDSEGFSLYICLVLLIANTLRILFWFGRHFETPLLLQSILMIIAMLYMIKVCVSIQNEQQLIKMKERTFTDFETKYFWKWTDFQSYIDFVLIFGIVGAMMMYVFIDIPLFVESVGLLALLTEAMLALPQFLKNYRNKSTHGMSIAMVTMWTVGDSFKTGYFIQRRAPLQFAFCGMLQILIDLAILGQVHVYRNNTMSLHRPIRAD